MEDADSKHSSFPEEKEDEKEDQSLVYGIHIKYIMSHDEYQAYTQTMLNFLIRKAFRLLWNYTHCEHHQNNSQIKEKEWIPRIMDHIHRELEASGFRLVPRDMRNMKKIVRETLVYFAPKIIHRCPRKKKLLRLLESYQDAFYTWKDIRDHFFHSVKHVPLPRETKLKQILRH